MITVSVLTAILAVVPPPAGAGTSAGAPVYAYASDEKITLNLRDADLKNLLEKLATLMDVTPIIAAGIGGTVTMSVNAPVSDILRDLEGKFQIVIRIADGRMFVSKVATSPEPLDDDAVDQRYLADPTLPRRPKTSPPRSFEGAVEFRTKAGDVLTLALATSARVRIPGCASDISLLPFPGDRFDALPGLILTSAGVLPRILSLALDTSLPVEISGCSDPVFARLTPTREGVVDAPTILPFGKFILRMEITEVSAQGEDVLSAPSIVTEGGEGASIQSGSQRRTPAGATLSQSIQTALVVVDADEKFATVALSGSVLRDVDPTDGGPLMTIRIAHARESARLEFGKKHRIVLAPTYGRGDSALVLDVAVERVPKKK